MNSIRLSLILFGLFFILGCLQSPPPHSDVGDIPYIEGQDNPNFKLCNENSIKQYYVRNRTDTPASYQGEKKAIIEHFEKYYQFPKTVGEDGYVTIRFIVNCEGKSGRFRVQEMDFKYQSKTFNEDIKQQLLTITKSLDGWMPVTRNDRVYDYYQYLSFRLEDGQIKKIMP